MVMELGAGSAKLTLHVDASNWCQVVLDVGGRYILGAESYPILLDKLLKSLKVDVPISNSGTIEGVGVTWVLSLSERHATIYTAQREGIRVLYFQDAEGRLIARLDLDEESRQRWVSLLEAAKHGNYKR